MSMENLSIEELQKSLEKLKNNGLGPNAQRTVSDEIAIETSSMSIEEQVTLSQMPEFKEANDLYTSAFNSFLMSKFKSEFISTTIGKQVAQNLLDVIRSCKEFLFNKYRKELEEFRLWQSQQENLNNNDN